MFKNKKILITGGKGFLGQALTQRLKKKYKVFSVGKQDYDLLNLNNVKKLFKDIKNIYCIIHLASDHGGLYYNIKNQGSIYYNNIILNSHLMHHAMLNGVKKFISAGTVDSYPKNANFPLSEKNIWEGYPEPTSAPYAFSKKMMLVQGEAYKQQFNFNHLQLLFMNLYGPNDDFNLNSCHVIPAIIKKIYLSKKKCQKFIKLFGSGEQKREFLYISDAAKALERAIPYNGRQNKINIGTGKVTTIKNLAYKIKKIMNYKGEILWQKNIESGIYKKNFNIKLSKKELNLKNFVDLNTGLKKTIKWFYEKN